MITYQYTQKDWTTFKEGIKREWAVTNGIGGYAGSSMIGAHSRTHQGYLIASLHAPIERYLVFSKINETATVGTSTVSFETSQHCASGKTVYTEGQKFLTSFIYDGSVHYTYETDNFSFEKHITLKRNANVCAVAYELTAGDSDCTFTLTPLFNYREHSESSTPDTLKFETFTEDRTFYLVPEKIKILPFVFRQVKELFPNAKLFMTSTCSYRLKWILRQMGLTAITVRLTCPLQFLPTQPKKFPSCAVSVT